MKILLKFALLLIKLELYFKALTVSLGSNGASVCMTLPDLSRLAGRDRSTMSRFTVVACCLLLACAVVAAQDAAAVEAPAEGAAAEEGVGCPFTLSLPWTFDNETIIDLSEKVEVEGDDNPLAVSTVCTCPASETIPTVCTCEGPKSDDCDPYAQILSAFFLFAEKFMVSELLLFPEPQFVVRRFTLNMKILGVNRSMRPPCSLEVGFDQGQVEFGRTDVEICRGFHSADMMLRPSVDF